MLFKVQTYHTVPFVFKDFVFAKGAVRDSRCAKKLLVLVGDVDTEVSDIACGNRGRNAT